MTIDLEVQKTEWAEAGVEGGIPQNVEIVSEINPSDDLQQAIDAVHESGGGVLFLNEGTYKISESINIKSGVILRGEDRDSVVIESSIRSTSDQNASIRFDNVQYAGIENLTLDYSVNGLEPVEGRFFDNDPYGLDDLYTGHIRIDESSSNNWVTSVNVLNAGTNPILVNGDNNTLSNNIVDGSFNRGGGGNGYYDITGNSNLIYGETVSNIRHFTIQRGAENNVITESRFEVDVNFHNGDGGSNLLEGNTIDLPFIHHWQTISTGAPDLHRPPGPGNVLINNDIRHENEIRDLDHEANTIYSYLIDQDNAPEERVLPETGGGYGVPENTGQTIPEGTTLFSGQIFADGNDIFTQALAQAQEPGLEVGANENSDAFTVSLFSTQGDQEQIDQIENGQTIQQSEATLDHLNIVAEVDNLDTVGSVRLSSAELGIDRIENTPPFALFGDINGNLNDGSLPFGNFTFTVEAFESPGATGNLLARSTFTLTLADSDEMATQPGEQIGEIEGDSLIGPNESSNAQSDFSLILGTVGDDTIDSPEGRQNVKAGPGDDNVTGSDDDDQLAGNAGNDVLVGGSGNDTILGGFGDDMIIGGSGDDILVGGANADTFFFGVDAGVLFGADAGVDRIVDFADDEDQLVLSGFAVEDADGILSRATQSGSNVIFDFENEGRLIIEDITIDAIADDLLFLP